MGDSITDFKATTAYLIEGTSKDGRIVGKFSRAGDPSKAAIVLYTTSEEHREELRSSLTKELRV